MKQKTSAVPKHTAVDMWRIFGSTVFATLAIISILGFMLVKWTHNYLLNTEQFTKIASELPKKPQVASALSKFTTQKLFEAIDVQTLVGDALPEKAKFLAAPLTAQLQVTATDLANNIIKSQQFDTAWTFIISGAHESFLKIVNASPLDVSNDQISKVGLQLGDVVRNVASQLGREEIGVAVDRTIGTATEVTFDLRAQLKLVRQAVAAVNYLYAILPLLALTLVLLAIWLSHYMSRAILAMSIAGILVVGLVLVALKAAKSEAVMQLQDPIYQAAIAVSWDVIVQGLVQMLAFAAIALTVTMMLSLLLGPYKWAKQLRKAARLEKVGHTRFGEWFELSRKYVEKYYLAGCGGAAVITIIVLLVAQQITWVSVLQATLAWLSFCLLLAIYIKRP